MYVPNRVDFNLDTKRLLGRLKNMNPSSREIISLNPYIKCMDVYLKNGISYTNTAISSDKPTYPDFQEMVDEVAESVRIQIPELLEGTPVEQIDWLIFPIADFLLRGMTLERGIIYLKLLSLVYPSISLLFPDITDSIEDYTSSFIPSDWSGSSAGTFYDQVKTSPKGKVTWGELARERVSGGWMFPSCMPLYDREGNFFGALGLDTDPSLLIEDVLQTELGETGYVFLMDGEGNALYYPEEATEDLNLPVLEEKEGFLFFTLDPSEIYPNVSLLNHTNTELVEMLKASLKGELQKGRVSIGGLGKYVVLVPIPELGWVIGGIVPYSEILAPVRNNILIAGAIAILGCLVGAFWMEGRIARSFSRISKVSSDIVGGNLNARIEADSPIAEFRQVGSDVNLMVETLQSAITNLQEKTANLLQSEKSLKEARAYTQAIIANIADPLWVIDTEGKVILINDAMERVTGYKKQEIEGELMPILPIFRVFIGMMDGKEKLINMVKGVLAGKHMIGFFTPWLIKSGDLLMMSCSGESLKDAGGKVIGGVFLGKDTHALQKAGVDAMKILNQRIEMKMRTDYEFSTLLFLVNANLVIGDSALDILQGTVSGFNSRFGKSVKIEQGMLLKNLGEEDWPEFLEFLLDRFYECIGPTTFECAEGIGTLEPILEKVKDRYENLKPT
jgi:PAS domain S-box-containing protein